MRRLLATDASPPEPAEPEPAAGFGGWVPQVSAPPEPVPDLDPMADDPLARWAPPPRDRWVPPLGGRHRSPDEDPGEELDHAPYEFDDDPLDLDDVIDEEHEVTAGVEPVEEVDPDPTDVVHGPPTGDEPTHPRRHRINGRWGRFAELWVPEPLRHARLDPGRRGMIVLVLVAAIAAIATAFGVWRDRPEPRPIETSTVAAVSDTGPTAASGSPIAAAPGPMPTGPAPASTGEIVVSVTGLVVNPGVVHLAAGSRVADAIAAAGGTAPGANLTGVNLAAKLADGDSVVVTDTPSAAAAPAGGAAAAGGSVSASAGLVNLNTADEAALDTLPGVGPVMAQNIIAWRESNGKFTSIEQLQEISGIGPSRYAQISALVTVG